MKEGSVFRDMSHLVGLVLVTALAGFASAETPTSTP